MKKIAIILVLPLFVLLTACGVQNDVENDSNSGSVETVVDENIENGMVELEIEEPAEVIETGKQEEDVISSGLVENMEKEVEDDIVIEGRDDVDSDSELTGSLKEQFEEIEDLFDDYANDITGDSVDETDVEIMYKIIDILTTEKE